MDTEPSLTNLNEIFKIPIFFNEKVKILNESVQNDLELTKTNEENIEKPIYEYIFNPVLETDKIVIQQFSKYYTNDTNYLKETQKQIDNINVNELNQINNKYSMDNYELTKVIDSWKEIRGETGFCEKYFYIDWDFAKEFNKNALFLQLKSVVSFISPLISLCIPIIILILPFFILKFKGIHLSLQSYITILKSLISEHAITKIFTEFHEVSTGQKAYLLVSSGLYLFSIYQNILSCIRFYSNMKKIHDYLDLYKKYISYSIDKMQYHIESTKNLLAFSAFNRSLVKHKNVLTTLLANLLLITPFSFSINKFINMGHIMKTFYEIYDNTEYNLSLVYSFGFNSYYNMLQHFKNFVSSSSLNKAKYNNKKPTFTNIYYPKFINCHKQCSKNSGKLNKNLIITGPNASGKTTLLKSLLINVLLSQQFGFGCFTELTFKPFDNIHCYLNIPDTSGRDSLFQAEARRCKEIIDSIKENEEQTHLCIFDELYSGTNPEEAVSSAKAFLSYLCKKENVCYMLTTHYVKLCKQLSKHNENVNYHMKTTIDENGKLTYMYLLEKGISNVKGGIKVLRDMNYPDEILKNINK